MKQQGVSRHEAGAARGDPTASTGLGFDAKQTRHACSGFSAVCDGAGRYDDINTDTVINYVTKLFPEETGLMADPGFWGEKDRKCFHVKRLLLLGLIYYIYTLLDLLRLRYTGFLFFFFLRLNVVKRRFYSLEWFINKTTSDGCWLRLNGLVSMWEKTKISNPDIFLVNVFVYFNNRKSDQMICG